MSRDNKARTEKFSPKVALANKFVPLCLIMWGLVSPFWRLELWGGSRPFREYHTSDICTYVFSCNVFYFLSGFVRNRYISTNFSKIQLRNFAGIPVSEILMICADCQRQAERENIIVVCRFGNESASIKTNFVQRRSFLISCILQGVSLMAESDAGDVSLSVIISHLNPLKTKRRLLYLKTQFVPRSKHFSSRL